LLVEKDSIAVQEFKVPFFVFLLELHFSRFKQHTCTSQASADLYVSLFKEERS